MNRIPTPNQLWQHFKGNIYKILLITDVPVNLTDILELPKYPIKHSETQEILTLSYCFGKKFALKTSDNNILTDKFVLYINNEPGHNVIWARPYDNFLEIISSPHIDGVNNNNYYRFNRIS